MTTLTLLQLNDLHGYLEPHPELVRTEGGWRVERLGGVARIARLFEEARAEGPCLTLDNGDTFHGTRVAVASRGEALVPIMNALKIDAMTAEKTADSSIDPDWSTHTTMCQGRLLRSAAK